MGNENAKCDMDVVSVWSGKEDSMVGLMEMQSVRLGGRTDGRTDGQNRLGLWIIVVELRIELKEGSEGDE